MMTIFMHDIGFYETLFVDQNISCYWQQYLLGVEVFAIDVHSYIRDAIRSHNSSRTIA
jgi:hypothetical protein